MPHISIPNFDLMGFNEAFEANDETLKKICTVTGSVAEPESVGAEVLWLEPEPI